ncbi:hypothetical protein GWK47_025586 [Chionoecetes opilio]|uniref:Chitin-binding type-2 domain-containing protein n=1 Tax=Chionoecetes opilio TaxID=41210 RepID=A0A8J8WB17_CHIOP|nr:hypothetical protein GWK47_025586 [Chionoecetes opilio]
MFAMLVLWPLNATTFLCSSGFDISSAQCSGIANVFLSLEGVRLASVSGLYSGPDHNLRASHPHPNHTGTQCHSPHPESPLVTASAATSRRGLHRFYYCDEHQSQSYHQCSDGLVFHPDLARVCMLTCTQNVSSSSHTSLPLKLFLPLRNLHLLYHCDDGTPVMMDCPGGLYWNQDMKSCDLPELVNCTMPVGAPTPKQTHTQAAKECIGGASEVKAWFCLDGDAGEYEESRAARHCWEPGPVQSTVTQD